ncbi:hypothetical protein [Tuwongella immobilis]|uniref:Uncharacterized protein n=1 Tax=Tuwongella immobilis TaxID=692036 RepID=A0A6C2YNQ4_9BACT|nr:hypothetical protein [Tuwongella immobilis]VIP02829.1 unnamed protein product [Tuwongella immobilis]VTS02575.1 unnamed protein product [Tuwongella immobilis]
MTRFASSPESPTPELGAELQTPIVATRRFWAARICGLIMGGFATYHSSGLPEPSSTTFFLFFSGLSLCFWIYAIGFGRSQLRIFENGFAWKNGLLPWVTITDPEVTTFRVTDLTTIRPFLLKCQMETADRRRIPLEEWTVSSIIEAALPRLLELKESVAERIIDELESGELHHWGRLTVSRDGIRWGRRAIIPWGEIRRIEFSQLVSLISIQNRPSETMMIPLTQSNLILLPDLHRHFANRPQAEPRSQSMEEVTSDETTPPPHPELGAWICGVQHPRWIRFLQVFFGPIGAIWVVLLIAGIPPAGLWVALAGLCVILSAIVLPVRTQAIHLYEHGICVGKTALRWDRIDHLDVREFSDTTSASMQMILVAGQEVIPLKFKHPAWIAMNYEILARILPFRLRIIDERIEAGDRVSIGDCWLDPRGIETQTQAIRYDQIQRIVRDTNLILLESNQPNQPPVLIDRHAFGAILVEEYLRFRLGLSENPSASASAAHRVQTLNDSMRANR